jgi:hypothetical protein
MVEKIEVGHRLKKSAFEAFIGPGFLFRASSHDRHKEQPNAKAPRTEVQNACGDRNASTAAES